MSITATRNALLFGLITVFLCLFLTGCQGPAEKGSYLAVEFHPEAEYQYKFVSNREIQLDLSGDEGKSDSKTQTEKLEMVFSIKAVENNPFGLSTLEITCEDVSAERKSFTGRKGSPDPVLNAKGKSYQLKISPIGKIENYDDYLRCLEEVGQTAFVPSTKKGQRIKNPDMFFDWIYFQSYLWDVISSKDTAFESLSVGDQWTSKQFMPWPVPIARPPTRDITYTVQEITKDPKKAVIKGSYALSEEPITDFLRPYSGSLQTKGSLFSVLRGYNYQTIDGGGTQVVNLETGAVESIQQDYVLKTKAGFILPLGNSVPYITITQSFSVELLNPPAPLEEPDSAAK